MPIMHPVCDQCKQTFSVPQAPWHNIQEALEVAGWHHHATRGVVTLLCPRCRRKTDMEVFRKVRTRTSYLRRRKPREGGVR